MNHNPTDLIADDPQLDADLKARTRLRGRRGMRSELREPGRRTATTQRHLFDDRGGAPLEVVLTAGIVCGLSAGVCYMLSRTFALGMPAVILTFVLGGLAAVLPCGYVCVKIADARPVRREAGE